MEAFLLVRKPNPHSLALTTSTELKIRNFIDFCCTLLEGQAVSSSNTEASL